MIDKGPRFWDTCYTTELTACATFQGELIAGSGPNHFLGGWRRELFTGSEPFRITAWGMKFPTKAELNLVVFDDAWNSGNPLDFGWTDYNFVVFTNEWEFAVGGDHYEGAAWEGHWIGRVPPLAGTRFAWRGETEDHRLVFDCIQRGAGSTKCMSVPATFTTFAALDAAELSSTTAPEPSTLLLVLTGLVLWKIARRALG
jgi:hypothetical protein